MSKILLHSQSLESAHKIKKIYERHLSLPIYHAFDGRSAERLLSREVFQLMVIDCDEYGVLEYNLVKDVRDGGYNNPIIVMPEDVPFGDLAEADNGNGPNRLHFIPKPVEDRTLVGVSKKLLTAKKAPQQRFTRFFTNQFAVMECPKTGASVMSNMYNLSKGGAYFEYNSDWSLTVGDLLKVKVILNEVDSERTLKGKVVWKTRQGPYSGRSGIGLRFLGI